MASPRFRDGGTRRTLAALTLLAGVLYLYQIDWGLPNGNDLWAVDAVRPLTPLAIARHSFLDGWNSGWFYYKYPLGHFFLLCTAYAPYLALVWLGGGLSTMQPEYPYGFAQPETVLYVLALLGRLVTVAMSLLSVLLLCAIGRRLWRSQAGLWGAAAAAVIPPVVYYAHTTNLDMPQIFWMLLAWYAALRTLEGARLSDTLLFGTASGMALATRESAYAWLLGLTLIVLVAFTVAWKRARVTVRQALCRLFAGAGAGLFVFLAACNAFYNPLGLWRRILYMTGHLPADTSADLVARAPLVFHHLFPNAPTLLDMGRIISWSMGLPWFAFALVGLAGSLRHQPRAAVCVLAPAVPYLVSVAGFPSLTARYLLPVTIALALCGGWTAARLWRAGRLARLLTVAVAAFTLVHGAGVDYLLARDPRYQLEDWLRRNAPAGTRIETYHKAPYRPRPIPGVGVYEPAFSRITIAGVEVRQPDFILISMSNLKRITQRYREDRRDPVRPPANAAFLNALLKGRLPYRPVARFHVSWPLLPERFIPALNPPLVLFERQRGGTGS